MPVMIASPTLSEIGTASVGKPSTTRKLFSVVVPTYCRPRELRRLLEALARVDFPREHFEVVIVNDGAPAGAGETVGLFAGQLDVTLVDTSHAGPASARNAGARAARGEYVVFTDDDCMPVPDWLGTLEAQVCAHPQNGIGGEIRNALTGDVFSTASQTLIQYLYDFYHVSRDQHGFFTTANLALPRVPFLELGGFDVSFPLAAAEDRDLCDRWRERGLHIHFAPDVVVEHAHSLNFSGFCRQHFNYGRGAVYLHRARDRRGREQPRFESLRFYRRLVFSPLGRGHGWRVPVLVALMILSQATYGFGYYWERFSTRPEDRSNQPGGRTTGSAVVG